MSSLFRKFISLDCFGASVNVNFKGDHTFKTCIGAFCSICLRAFILAYTVITIIDVVDYKDPQITQVSLLYPQRSNDLI